MSMGLVEALEPHRVLEKDVGVGVGVPRGGQSARIGEFVAGGQGVAEGAGQLLTRRVEGGAWAMGGVQGEGAREDGVVSPVPPLDELDWAVLDALEEEGEWADRA
jgi:hypothetical protein